MRCRAGDLAVIVKAGNAPQFLGRLVTCVSSYEGECGRTGWRVDPKLPGWDGVFDDSLRPIRPQPDDAADESTTWLPPVPTKEHA